MLNDHLKTAQKENATSELSFPSFLIALKHFSIVTVLGFASGLPLALVGSTLQAWFAMDGASIMVVGLLSLVGQPYILKFLWAPWLDCIYPKSLGRRRGWVFVTQIALIAGLLLLSQLSPHKEAILMGVMALLIAFFSATQDVAIDAYRTELLLPHERGLGATLAVLGYRLATLVSGGGALVIAAKWGWAFTYIAMAFCLVPPMCINLFSKEPGCVASTDKKKQAFVLPFLDLMQRYQGILILVFIFLYKLGESFTSTTSGLTMVFLLKELGFSLSVVGIVNKGVGILAIIAGSLIAGVMMLRLSLYRALLWFGLLQAVTNLLFVLLAYVGNNFQLLVLAVSLDNLSAGMGLTALLAFMMSWCTKEYAATQFALLSALSGLPRVVSGPLGAVVQENIGWFGFYIFAFLTALPAIGLLFLLKHTIVQAETK